MGGLELKFCKTDNFDVVACGSSNWPVDLENGQLAGSLWLQMGGKWFWALVGKDFGKWDFGESLAKLRIFEGLDLCKWARGLIPSWGALDSFKIGLEYGIQS